MTQKPQKSLATSSDPEHHGCTHPGGWSRRQFLSAAAAGTAATLAAQASLAAPAILTSAKTDRPVVTGAGEHRYEVNHHWAQLPAEFQWQTTHNAAVDGQGLVYVIHEGHADKPEHPSIFVFAEDGRYVRSFGQQFQGGGHGIEVRREGNEEFLYVCAYQQVKALAKLTLTGEVVWLRHAPMDSGLYAADEASNPQRLWGRDRFLPTNFAFLPDGDFLLADGYGSFYIHRYDADGNWKSCFGGPGAGEGTFDTPHGLWIDSRGATPRLVVADRAHHTLQFLSLDGEYQETIEGFGLPANLATHEQLLLVPELAARVTLMNPAGEIVARLGDDFDRIAADTKREIRSNPDLWQEGKFVHPHDACFDATGNIYVPEWVSTGRVTKLTRLS